MLIKLLEQIYQRSHLNLFRFLKTRYLANNNFLTILQFPVAWVLKIMIGNPLKNLNDYMFNVQLLHINWSSNYKHILCVFFMVVCSFNIWFIDVTISLTIYWLIKLKIITFLVCKIFYQLREKKLIQHSSIGENDNFSRFLS